MKHYITLILTFFIAIGASAQSHLYVRGSAVPGGVQELEKFSTSTSSKFTFKFHGKLLPGDLYITTTAEPKSTTYYYAPRLVDSNIVCDATAYAQKKDSIGSDWAVLFEADNYRFTVDPTAKTVEGELFAQWYEAWICGGCVADRQGYDKAESEHGHWQITAGKAMVQDWNDPYVWEWTGELKGYTANQEPKRFKINGQYGWSPKVLHPFTQDASILTAKQVWYNGSADNKWRIINDGYYRIRIDVFRETIEGEYLGTTLPDGIEDIPELELDLSVSGRQITVSSADPVSAVLFTVDGLQLDAATGAHVTLTAPTAGIYILYASNGNSNATYKVVVK